MKLAKAVRSLRSPYVAAWDTYYLKIATTHFAVCCADIEHRQIGVVEETEVGGVPGFPVLERLRLDRPLQFPRISRFDGRRRPLRVYSTRKSANDQLRDTNGRTRARRLYPRSRVEREFLFYENTYYLRIRGGQAKEEGERRRQGFLVEPSARQLSRP